LKSFEKNFEKVRQNFKKTQRINKRMQHDGFPPFSQPLNLAS